jgi:hypothetical protein
MDPNSLHRHSRAGVLAVEAVEAPVVVTSAWIDEQLADTYERVGIRPGLLAEVAGIVERRWWEPGTGFAEAAAPRRVFFRRGEIDSWREELAPDLVAQIETRHGEVMRRLGYLS